MVKSTEDKIAKIGEGKRFDQEFQHAEFCGHSHTFRRRVREHTD